MNYEECRLAHDVIVDARTGSQERSLNCVSPRSHRIPLPSTHDDHLHVPDVPPFRASKPYAIK